MSLFLKKTEHIENNIAIIILAAGSSSRLGQPKQLVTVDGNTLLNRTLFKANKSKVKDIYVILGSGFDKIIPSLSPDSSVIINSDWHKGMGKSIAVAIKEIADKNYDGVIILLSDQVYLEEHNIDNLIDVYLHSSKSIVLSKYKNGQGPPSLFDKKYFNALSQLNDDNGAKLVVKQNYADVDFVLFENGDVDVDNPEDLIRFQSEE